MLDDNETKKQYMDYVLRRLKYPYETDRGKMYKSYKDLKSDKG